MIKFNDIRLKAVQIHKNAYLPMSDEEVWNRTYSAIYILSWNKDMRWLKALREHLEAEIELVEKGWEAT